MNAHQHKAVADYAADRSLTNRNRLVEEHIYLVNGLIRRMFNNLSRQVVEDLRSAGIIGLIHAADRFIPKVGVRFDTYAAHRVRGAIIDACRRADTLSRQNRDRVNRWEAATVMLSHRLCRPPTPKEVEQELGIRPRAWDADLAAHRVTASNASVVGRKADVPEHELLAGAFNGPSHEDVVDSADEFRSLLSDESLSEHEQQALRLRFGDGLYVGDVAAAMNYSQSYVYTFLRDGLSKLRNRVAIAA